MTSANTKAWIAAAFFALAVGTLAKVYWNALEELERGDDAFARKEYAQAVTHYERSIQWFLPRAGVQDRAAEGLWKAAFHYETAGEIRQAIDAYRLLRSAFYSARSFYTPGGDWIARCNERIADLTSGLPASAPDQKNKTREQRKNEALSVLRAEKPPHAGWAFLGVAGFLGWVGCAILFILKGITRSGKLKMRPAVVCAGGFLVCYGLWLWGMANV